MKKRELKELRKKDQKDLEKFLTDQRTLLQRIKWEVGLGKNKNVSQIKKVKKNIAQILTILKEKWQKKD